MLIACLGKRRSEHERLAVLHYCSADVTFGWKACRVRRGYQGEVDCSEDGEPPNCKWRRTDSTVQHRSMWRALTRRPVAEGRGDGDSWRYVYYSDAWDDFC